MKNKLKLVFGVIAAIIVSLIIFICFIVHKINNADCSPPLKPDNVPKEAIWSGGCDGGEWIELIGIEENKYRFRIYTDRSGELRMDANWKIKNCNSKDILTVSNWKDIVCCYLYNGTDKELFTMNLKNREKGCHLEIIYPAYGGIDWEITKDLSPNLTNPNTECKKT